MAYSGVPAALIETDATMHAKHTSLKTLKQRCWFYLHKQRPAAIFTSALESCRADLSDRVLGQSRGNIVKIRAQEVIVNAFKNLTVFFCLENLYQHGPIVSLNLVPCYAG